MGAGVDEGVMGAADPVDEAAEPTAEVPVATETALPNVMDLLRGSGARPKAAAAKPKAAAAKPKAAAAKPKAAAAKPKAAAAKGKAKAKANPKSAKEKKAEAEA